MRAVSLWQPSASLIAIRAKRKETRSWAPPARIVGERIAIHASKTRRALSAIETEPFRSVLLKAGSAGTLVTVDDELPLGAIVATAVVGWSAGITDEYARRLEELDPQEFAFGDYQAGRYVWGLLDVKPLSRPVPCLGRQRVFVVADELLAG